MLWRTGLCPKCSVSWSLFWYGWELSHFFVLYNLCYNEAQSIDLKMKTKLLQLCPYLNCFYRPTVYSTLSDLFSFAVLSGNAAWRRSFLARERGEEGEWDEWEGGGRTKKRGPTFPLLSV
jgi:hypothetical protein